MSEPGLLHVPISSGTIRENTDQWYLLKHPIFHVEILCEYSLRNRLHNHVCEYQLKWTCTFNVISKTPVFSIEIPGPALDLIPILPILMCTFHQNTNRGLKKRIRVYFHLKYYHTLNPVCTFNQYHKKIFNFTWNYSLLTNLWTNLFNFTLL